jgi:D-threo-aldose 1-dehydrogenase
MSRGENVAGAAPIEWAQLGTTGVRVTRLGLGTAPMGGLYEPVSEDDARGALQVGWDSGMRFFDTAPLYGAGLSERRVGAFLRTQERNTFTLETKVGRLLVPADGGASPGDGGDLKPVFDFSADGARRSLEESLTRMGMDRVDVALIHDPDDHYPEALEGTYPALHELRAAGVIGAIGAGMNQVEMLERFVRETDIDCVLIAGRYTLLDDRAATSLLPACGERGVGVVIGGVFNSGILAEPGVGAHFNYQPASAELVARARKIRDITESHGVPLPAAAIQYPLRDPRVTTIAVGARSGAEAREDVAYFTRPIPEGLWSDLDASGLLGWR